jgi:nucleoside-diphosphate-sugar epimerase
VDVVTGAFSFTGRYIAARLLELGREVGTLTRHSQRESPFGERVQAFPLDFTDIAVLAERLRGADCLYNTYWIRAPREEMTFERVLENTGVLLRAAREAGVRRVVQLSVSNASASSPLPYFSAKAAADEALIASGLSYAIVRPTLVFAREDVLVNNIGWLLRRVPVFVVPGAGDYTLQPVAVEDVAALAVDAGLSEEAAIMDAVGPDVFTFDEFIGLVREAVGSKARIVHGGPGLALGLSRLLGGVLRDTLVTREELAGLMQGLLTSKGEPTGSRRFADWLRANGESVGRRYVSETRRNWS